MKHLSLLLMGLFVASISLFPIDGFSMGSRVPAVGTTAEDFKLTDLAGKQQSLSQYRGKVVLVNFWATSCVPCVAEMPKLVEAWRRYAPRGFETVAVAMNYDPPNAVAEFAQRHALPFRVALDADGAVAAAFGHVSVTPTTYLLDRQGRIVTRYVGEPNWTDFRTRVERALADPA